MESFSPTNWFINVDLPTFGLPTMLTNPALCDILYYKLEYKVKDYMVAIQLNEPEALRRGEPSKRGGKELQRPVTATTGLIQSSRKRLENVSLKSK